MSLKLSDWSVKYLNRQHPVYKNFFLQAYFHVSVCSSIKYFFSFQFEYFLEGWYVLQTNYDNWKNPPFFDDRRTTGLKCMSETTTEVSVSYFFIFLNIFMMNNSATKTCSKLFLIWNQIYFFYRKFLLEQFMMYFLQNLWWIWYFELISILWSSF